jgi:hypothetical protein
MDGEADCAWVRGKGEQMSELFIPEDLHEMYAEAIAHPNEYWAPGVVKSLIERIAILDAENVAVWEAVNEFCGASEKQAICDYVMVADEKPPA